MSSTADRAVPNRRRSRGEEATSAIKQFILDNRLRPGDPLPTEEELVGTLGVSRSSVREALRTLQSLDIVEIRHGRGMAVGRLSFAPMVEAAIFRAQLNSEDDLRTLREVVEIRTQLDLAVTDQLLEHFRGSEQSRMRSLVETMRERDARGESFIEQDEAFHRALLAGTENQTLTALVLAFWEVHTRSIPLLGLPQAEDIRHTVDAHEAMLDALVAGDAEAYRAAVHDHYRPLKKLLAQALL